jgi:ABC-2 type transport system permease protein
VPVKSLRILVVGGLMSYRALFYWLTPWVFIPTLLVAPTVQILLFAYLGRSARLESDAFFLIGNAIQYSSVPCLFAMVHTIVGERNQSSTLGIVLSTPAWRVPLFLGRALPVVVNGWLVSLTALATGSVILGVRIPLSAWPPIAAVMTVGAMSCTGLGLVSAALGLRVRTATVVGNIVVGILLVFTGANVPLDTLPAWMRTVSPWMPLTNTIEAARRLVDGRHDVAGLVAAEFGLCLLYISLGLALLHVMEQHGRRHASLELE